VEGLFVATPQQILNLYGKNVNFGEALGKHSEVYGVIEDKDITKLDVSSSAVEEVSKVLGMTWSGYNPLEYLDDGVDDDMDNSDGDNFEYIG
jgi:hypothetical protein